MQKVRVMIVDDSLFFREFLSQTLNKDPGIEVVGTAADVTEARQKVGELQPDVITLDMEMPGLRGTDFLKYVRPAFPQVQVVVVSSVSGNVFEALRAGAVDFIVKPSSETRTDQQGFVLEAVAKIKAAAISARSRRVQNVARQMAGEWPVETRPAPAPRPVTQGIPKAPKVPKASPPSRLVHLRPDSVIAIGASTGGTEAILKVLRGLPTNSPGIVIVQHMPPVFTQMYADRLNQQCELSVREARNGDRVQPGLALLAPGDKHMRLHRDPDGYHVSCSDGEKVSGHCPSVDALFESVAKACGDNAIGVILTGMGADGARHLRTMRQAGAYTIGQDQATCVVYGMPMAAWQIGAVVDQLPLDSIAGAITRYLSSPHK